MTRWLPLALALVLGAVPALAQDLHPPADWRVRADDGSSGDGIWFVEMPPGWHVTTGPAALLWDPAATAGGEFTVETEVFRFAGEGPDGYGLFFGGSDLDGEGADYFAFLVDRDGRYRLYHQAGPDTHEIVPWTPHPAIASRPADPGADNAKNVLTAVVGSDSLHFRVNGESVTSFARPPYFDTSGNVGLRVHGGVDTHFTRLDVTPRAAAE